MKESWLHRREVAQHRQAADKWTSGGTAGLALRAARTEEMFSEEE